MTKEDFTNGSWIQYVTWDSETLEMVIQTSKREYMCVGVSREIYESFRDSPSKGKFFNEVIKSNFSHAWFK